MIVGHKLARPRRSKPYAMNQLELTRSLHINGLLLYIANYVVPLLRGSSQKGLMLRRTVRGYMAG